jgi:GntR family transcriptional regulator
MRPITSSASSVTSNNTVVQAAAWNACLPRHRFAHFTDTFDPATSLYAAVRASGVTFGSAVERLETVLASPREAALLETTTAMPMLRLHRRSVDTEGRPIEVVRSLYRGDRVAFEALLTDR